MAEQLNGEKKLAFVRAQLVPHVSSKATSGLEVPNNNSSGRQVTELVPQATSGLEVPNNNSPGQQLVPQATSGLEVPNNNSSGQQVDHVAIYVGNNIEDSNNSGPQDGNNDDDWKPAGYFAAAGCGTAMIPLLNNPPSSGEPVYLMAEVIVFTASVLELLISLWVSRDAHNRRAVGRKTWYASIIVLVLGLMVDAYTLN